MSNILRRREISAQTKPEPLYDCEVEYIKSTGENAYINTGYIPDGIEHVYCEFYYETPLSQNDISVSPFGCFESWGVNCFGVAIQGRQVSNNCIFMKGNSAKYFTGNVTICQNSWQPVYISVQALTIFGASTMNSSSATYKYPVYLFGMNAANGICYGTGTMKRIRSFWIKSNPGEWIMDLIPVRKGTVGYMYDRISNRLFGSAGPGSFIVGPDVTN